MIKIISLLLVLIPTIAFSADGVFTNLRATNARFTNFSTVTGKFHGTSTGTFTGSFVGPLLGNVVGNVTGNLSGNTIGTCQVPTVVPTLEEARTTSACINKTVAVSSDLTQAQSNITAAWPADRGLEIRFGGSLLNSTAFTFTDGRVFTAWQGYVFKGTGTITGLIEARPEWWGITTTTALRLAINSVVTGGTVRLEVATYISNYTDSDPCTLQVKIIGSGMPGYSSDATHMVGGSIIQGPFVANGNYSEFADFGVDSGSLVMSARTPSANQDGFKISAQGSGFTNPIKRIVARNISALSQSSTALFHAILIEGVDGMTANNLQSLFGVFGIAVKAVNSNFDGLHAVGSSMAGIIIKSDDIYGQCYKSNFNNLTIGSNNTYDGGGLYLLGYGDSSLGSLNQINISNVNTTLTTFGIRIGAAAGSIAQDINFNNIQVQGSSTDGIDIGGTTAATKRVHFSNTTVNNSAMYGYSVGPNASEITLDHPIANNSGYDAFIIYAGDTVLSHPVANVQNNAFNIQGATLYIDNWLSSYNSTAEFAGPGKPLTANSENMHTPTLLNSYVALGGLNSSPGYYFQGGDVVIQGAVKSGSGLNVPIFTLPAAYRPVEVKTYPAICLDGNFVTAHGLLEIRQNGDVVLTSGNSNYVHLDGIRFRAAFGVNR